VIIMMRIEDLSKNFGGIKAIDSVSFSINDGEILGVIGPNGSGKTTLINIVTGVYPCSSGKIYLDKTDITKLNTHDVVRKGISRTFQGVRIFNDITVINSVITGMHVQSKASFFASIVNSKSKHEEDLNLLDKAEEILQFTGLIQIKNKLSKDLSLKHKQLLAFAIALAPDPKLLFLDEPTAGLVAHEKDEFLELFKRVRDNGVTVVIVEHDMRVIMNMCERIIVLDSGKKIAEGKPEEVCNNPEVQRAYLGCEFTDAKT
jgi:branched-chain amino acid transport system ATP-binding protein